MAEQTLSLRERTTVIAGPLTNLTQNIATLFTQSGSDIVFLDKNQESCQRMANVLNDQREVNEKFGRASAIKCDFSSAKACHEALSQSAQTFGSIDIYIDTLFGTAAAPIRGENALKNFDELIDYELKPSFYLAHQVLNYLKNRKRGRLIFLTPEPTLNGSSLDTIHSLTRGGLCSFVKSLSHELSGHSFTANVVSIGPTEEYALHHFPQSGSAKEALEKLKGMSPQSKLLNSEAVAGTLLYLCSQLGNSMNGQTITLL